MDINKGTIYMALILGSIGCKCLQKNKRYFMFKDKKVLVTGGTGLIGIPLVEMLIKRGVKVTIRSLYDLYQYDL